MNFLFLEPQTLLYDLYMICSPSGHEEQMKAYLKQVLPSTKASFYEDAFGNLFITRGEAHHYPCLVAHLDEVHKPCERVIRQEEDIISATDADGKPVGIGADDKNGIWIIMRMLRESDLPMKAALFVQEERHCEGSSHCDWSFFEDVRFLMQLDRGGTSDLVTIGAHIRLSDDDYWNPFLMEKYGYKTAKGGMTDVVNLVAMGLCLPCCNVSVGYHNQHTAKEYTCINELENACSFVREMLEESQL
ncbi:MAG: hypothetical protein K6A67_06145 [Bacteroidales bacterium]|nr:hypothetical protein [Bacteroidales bacterium]